MQNLFFLLMLVSCDNSVDPSYSEMTPFYYGDDRDKEIVDQEKFKEIISNLEKAKKFLQYYGLNQGLNRIKMNTDDLINDNVPQVRDFTKSGFTCVMDGQEIRGSNPNETSISKAFNTRVNETLFHEKAIESLKNKKINVQNSDEVVVELKYTQKEKIAGNAVEKCGVAVIAGNKFFGFNSEKKFYCYSTYQCRK